MKKTGGPAGRRPSRSGAKPRKTRQDTRSDEILRLRQELEENRDALRAIREGEVDAVVVSGPDGEQVYTLKNADQPYRVIVERMSEGTVTVDDRGVILYSNRQFAEFLKTPLSKLVGRSIFDFVQPADRSAAEGLLDTKRRKSGKTEVTFQTAKGEWLPANVSFAPCEIDRKPLFCGVIADVSAQRRAQDALRETTALLERIFASTHIAIAYLDLRFRYIRVNETFAEAFGHPPDFFPGRNHLDLFPDDENGRIFQAVVDTGTPHSAFDSPFPGSGERSWDWNVQPVRSRDGRVLGIILSLVDRTEWKRSELERQALEKQVLQLQRMESLGRLAGGVAHDLNNILFPIILNTEWLLNEAEPETPRHKALDEVLRAAYRQRNLVRQILTFARRREHERKPVKLGPLLEDTLSFLRSSLPSSVEIRVRLDATEDTITGDLSQLRQVIVNLCQNAADAMEEAGETGLLKVALDNVRFPVNGRYPGLKPGMYVRFTVEDTGHGISPEQLDHIFEPFYTTKELGQGVGMGLPVVYGIVTSHGGTIEVRTEMGKGTRFDVYLPTIRPGIAAHPSPPEPAAAAVRSAGARVLIVDDEALILESSQHALQLLGHEVTTSQDSVKALEIFRDRPNDFDVVIVDQTMPRMTGSQLVPQLHAVRPDLPVILMTGYSQAVDEDKAREIGVRQLLMKPMSISDLSAAVERALRAG